MAITYEDAITTTDATTLQTEWTESMAAADPPVQLTGFSATSAERGVIALEARAIAKEQSIRAEVVKAGFLVDVEERDPAWIDRFVEGFFSDSLDVPFTRFRATKARHRFTLTNQSATGGPYTILADRRLKAQAIDGTVFENIEGGTLAAGVGQELTIEFEAVVSGLSGNIGPGDIYKIQGGALPGVDISNPIESQTFVARADETNVEYVTRALARWGTLAAGGHVLAVAYRILTGVETITKIGVRDDNPNGQSSVDVFLANAAGPATNAECLAAAAVFGPYEPLGSRGRWRYLPAIAKTLFVEATLELDGTNPDALADAEYALALLQAQWPMRAGSKLDESLLRGVLRGGRYAEYVVTDADGNEAGVVGFRGVTDVDMSSPSDDETLGAEEVLVLNVTLTAA